MRKMEDSLIINAIIHRRDVSTVINCLKSGVEVSEFLLYNARSDVEMLHAIVLNCSHVIEIKNGMIFTYLCMNYIGNRNIIWFLLNMCKVSVGHGFGGLLLTAIHNGDLDMVQFMCNNWEVVLNNPLVVAARHCQHNIVKFILSKGLVNVNTLDIALSDAIFANIESTAKTEQLKKVVALLCKHGASKTTSLLKLCAFMSLNNQDFEVLITLLSFYDLKDVIKHLESYASGTTSCEQWLEFVADAFRLQKAVKKIVHGFRVHRRLNLARCIYSNKSIYSPALVYTIARYGGLI